MLPPGTSPDIAAFQITLPKEYQNRESLYFLYGFLYGIWC